MKRAVLKLGNHLGIMGRVAGLLKDSIETRPADLKYLASAPCSHPRSAARTQYAFPAYRPMAPA
jgi:hypothetical protein